MITCTASSVRRFGMWQAVQSAFAMGRVWRSDAWHCRQTAEYRAAASAPRGMSCGLWHVVQVSFPALAR